MLPSIQSGLGDAYYQRRLEMVERQLRARGIHNPRLLALFERLPRHLFVPDEVVVQAYEDRPLPIGEQQTISQPYIVASMLDRLALQPQHQTLEIGTGSGYQTALLAELTAQVDSVERVAVLAARAKGLLDRLGYKSFTISVGDGTRFSEESRTYDRIIVSAAAPRVPEALVHRLRTPGRMIVPVGIKQQVLRLVSKDAGGIHEVDSESCAFVPLIGEQGFAEDV